MNNQNHDVVNATGSMDVPLIDLNRLSKEIDGLMEFSAKEFITNIKNQIGKLEIEIEFLTKQNSEKDCMIAELNKKILQHSSQKKIIEHKKEF